MSGGLLNRAEIEATAGWIASLQVANGMIPWFPGGHADPWNHTEAAMALVVAGRVAEAEAAYAWLASTQLPDGSWCLYHLGEGIEEPRRDPNVCAYVAAGVWWHYLETGDEALVERMWPVVSGAVDFVLGLQTPGGEVLWNRDVDGRPGTFALLTANSSIYHSLRCAVAIAELLGFERPDWELAAGRVGHAVAHRPGAFEIKDRWAMDWYYPVLSGAVTGDEAADRLAERWDAFRHGRDRRALCRRRPVGHRSGDREVRHGPRRRRHGRRAAALLAWTRRLRHRDGTATGRVRAPPRCALPRRGAARMGRRR